ncbi:MAG: hypothetical protein V4694_06600 [Pseudomonadota bacterium]
MLPKLKIEFTKITEPSTGYVEFKVDKSCQCYWLEGGNEIIVVPSKSITSLHSSGNYAILISFDFMRCLDPDGGHEWVEKKLKLLIKSLIKNRKYILD